MPEEHTVFSMNIETDAAEPGAPDLVSQEGNWHATHQEGQLAVDIYETKKDVVILSPIAGADTRTLEVNVHNDVITIRGMRNHPLDESLEETYYQECHWGKFSRTIVLPVDVKGDSAQAQYEQGILKITIPKRRIHKSIPVVVVEE